MRIARLIVKAGLHDRMWCPVQCKVAADAALDLDKVALWDKTDGVALPVQAWREEDGQVSVAWVIPSMVAEETREFELQAVEGCCAPKLTDGVRLEQVAPGKLKVFVGGKHFTTYNYGEQVVHPYLYPVLAADGVGVTRNWPMIEGVAGESNDHPHHKGIYTAQDAINGNQNWGEGEGHGWQVHKGFARTFSGPVAGGFTSKLDWTDHDKNVYMTETRRVTFYLTPQDGRIFDYEVTLHASEGALTIGDTKEGGLISARMASSIEAERENGGIIETGSGGKCQGKDEQETWGKRAPWCDYSGPVADGWYGICLMDHLTNPRFPTYWHVRAYGLMTANCFGLHDFYGDPNIRGDMDIPAGESRTWRYRVMIHHGDATTSNAALHFESFNYPPSVEVRYH
ncbi:MAG: hypothetical protein GXY76_04255 [Chloroflexi bacterium]|nr:hypothetical protein [Chloroflexota bacterium]